MEWLSVSEAAARLGIGVRRVRQLIEREDLPARRIGKSWAVGADAVARRADREAPPGRPYSLRNSWRMAAIADAVVLEQGDAISGSSAARWHARRALRNLLAHEDLDVVVAMLRARSNSIVNRYVHRSLLDKLAVDTRLVKSGARAAESTLDLIADDRLEAYVKAGDLASIDEDYGLQEAPSDRANVFLRMIDDDVPWSAPDAPLLLVAADLRDSDDARARETSDRLLRKVQAALESAYSR